MSKKVLQFVWIFVILLLYSHYTDVKEGRTLRLLSTTKLFRGQERPEKKLIKAPADRTVLSGGRRLRHELKYIINEGTYRVLMGRLAPLMQTDPHAPDGGYRVTSVYFDDIYCSAYQQKLNGIETRRKFRIRAYDLDPSLINLESKHKDDSYVSKLSKRLTEEQYRSLLNGDSSFMEGSDSEEDAFGEYYRSDLIARLRPTVIVDYRREALVYPFGNVRITFDRELSACFNTIDMFSPQAQYTRIFDKEIILEVKFDKYIPESIQAALHGLKAPQESVSKFILCTDRMLEVKSHG